MPARRYAASTRPRVRLAATRGSSSSSSDSRRSNPEEVVYHVDRMMGSDREAVVQSLWLALKNVEDPEIPVAVVDMGLIVSIDYDPGEQVAKLRITYTAMGCPAMDMIQDDIRARLLREPGVARVEIDLVWDPVWTHRRLSESARESMRGLGLSV